MAATASMDAPDLDTIKMFVGQIPKSWTELEVTRFFEEFGRIFSITILRDKVTRESRGCCFITFYHRKSALNSQNICHNIRILPGMSHPMQVKPADNENRHERKIFVGMLTKSLTESDLRALFLPFGLIEEVSILRDGNGTSRGCGFVTFATKASAVAGIKKMNQSTLMPGCSSPLVVKIADIQQRNNNVEQKVPRRPTSLPPGLKIGPESYLKILLAQHPPENLNLLALPNSLPQPTSNLLQTDIPLVKFANVGFANNELGLHQVCDLDSHAKQCDTISWGPLIYLNPSPPKLMLNSWMKSRDGLSTAQPRGQADGPDGSNLFIYHLPQDYTDVDLIQLFAPFGFIVSAKVFMDRSTNLSKCFGFISYNNRISARLAINALNGFSIGAKRLKVQYKRPKPY